MVARIERRQETNGVWYVAVDTATGLDTSFVTRYGRRYLTHWLQQNGHSIKD